MVTGHGPLVPLVLQCVIFSFRYLKQKIWNVVLDQQPNNLRQLREAIVMECNTMHQATIQRSFDAMVSRARLCINTDGQALADE